MTFFNAKTGEGAAVSARHLLRNLLLAGLILVIGAVGIGAGAFWYAESYTGRVFPGVTIGNYPLGGLTQGEVENVIEEFNNRLAKDGLNFVVDGSGHKNFDITTGNGEDTVQLVKVEIGDIPVQAINAGRQGSFLERLFEPVLWRFNFVSGIHLTPVVTVLDRDLRAQLQDALVSFEAPAHNAKVVVDNMALGSFHVLADQAGDIFDYDELVGQIKQSAASLALGSIAINRHSFAPTVSVSEAEAAAQKLSAILGAGDVIFTFSDPETKKIQEWHVPPTTFSSWLIVEKNSSGDPVLLLDRNLVASYLDSVALDINVPAVEAKFSVGAGKVKEIQSARAGRKLNAVATVSNTEDLFAMRGTLATVSSTVVPVVIDSVDPIVTLNDLNGWGVTQVIGVGSSTFKDSHSNRIKNIALAVQRLNGSLIKPGEEFSANRFAGPFTAENGFLPEEIIKGDSIVREIGGGMCQIGTTLFRMAMNTGMPITERHNHSLVVRYYADPVNGNPGTDATLFDPVLDLKFLNDTGSYLILQTEIDYKKQILLFKLWGKPDGRTGGYTRPLVSKWIPAPTEIQEKITDKLAPGERKCQVSFRGAVASFTYSRQTPAGEKIDRVFSSYYRPLPQICLVGAGVTSTAAVVSSSDFVQN